jgi:hypothetical protein
MQEPPQELPHIGDPHTYTEDTLSIPYPMETTHPPPKPYKLRPSKIHKPHIINKRKMHQQNPHINNQYHPELYKQPQPTIKHSSVAQAPPRIHMAFPAPSIMPHRNPPLSTTKYKQTTIEEYMRRHNTQDSPKQKLTQSLNKPTHKREEHNTSTTTVYRHPPI